MRNPNTTKAYEYLRKRILAGELAPGAFLSALSLSKEIGVSRTPVREALRQLENDELVTIVPKLGAVVRTLTDDQFLDLLEYREALEVHAAGRAAELRRPEEVEQLRTVLQTMRLLGKTLTAKREPDPETRMRLGELDIHFHRIIMAAARNPFLRDRFERAHILQRMVTPSLLQRWLPEPGSLRENALTVFNEHAAIRDAIEKRDAEQARRAMQVHMQNFSAKIHRHRASLGESLTARSLSEPPRPARTRKPSAR